MDLFAYANIPNLKSLAEANGIEVPRLRGYALMSEECEVTQNEINDAVLAHYSTMYRNACTSEPRFHPESNMHEYSPATDRLQKKYLITEIITEETSNGEIYTYEKIVGFKWNLIHGKDRKTLKFALKKAKRAVEKYYHTFNKYAGREDVMRVHARIGGGNWPFYFREVVDKPWFLEKVDDYFDDTYCDIYCKIDKSQDENAV